MGSELSTLLTALTNFGGLGVVIAFLIWKDIRADRVRERIDVDHRAELRIMEERRLSYDKERLETDKEQAATLAALASAIQSRVR